MTETLVAQGNVIERRDVGGLRFEDARERVSSDLDFAPVEREKADQEMRGTPAPRSHGGARQSRGGSGIVARPGKVRDGVRSVGVGRLDSQDGACLRLGSGVARAGVNLRFLPGERFGAVDRRRRKQSPSVIDERGVECFANRDLRAAALLRYDAVAPLAHATDRRRALLADQLRDEHPKLRRVGRRRDLRSCTAQQEKDDGRADQRAETDESHDDRTPGAG